MVAQVFFALAFAASAHGVSPDSVRSDSVRSDRDIRLAALRHVADVRRCYEHEGLTRDPQLAGSLDVTVTVLPTGEVSDARIAADAMRGFGAREGASCLTTAIRNWRFDRGAYVAETIVFPFKFSPLVGQERRLVTG